MVLLKWVILTLALLMACIWPVIGTEIAQFEWIGMDADKIGEWDSGMPDGSMDGHFLLDLNLPAPTEIESILIYTADASGNPVGGQFWHTAATNYWMLGVFDQGTQLNYNHVTSLGTFSGNVQFDLYGDDSGWFKKGNWFGLEVTLGDGTKLKRLISIGGDSSSTQYTALHRWFSTQSGDHFYTTDPSGELAPTSGYTYEGITGYIATSQQQGTTALYRWFSTQSGDHFYTTDPSGELAPTSGYAYEGITGYIRQKDA
ncbi:MAG: hypothetical protein NTY37_11100 [Methanothrix sp.]|nr:hypothetical protein [Methanothrix sp.]